MKRTTEDYLKTVYILSKKGEVRGIRIAEELGVSHPTVSYTLKSLEKEGYLFLDENHIVHLTEIGKDVAKQTYERHITLKQLLLDLGVDVRTASKDACKMEHAVSAESFAALKKLTEERNRTEGSDQSEKKEVARMC